jgi:hypothetical protein
MLNDLTGQGTTDKAIFLTQQLSAVEHNDIFVITFHIVVFPRV